jgi:hypothetical protein
MRLTLIVVAAILSFSTSVRADRRYPGGPGCGGSMPIQCAESCQRFEFDGSCQYRTSCTMTENCLKATSCGDFNFEGRCLFERTETQCRAPGGYPPSYPISCETTCQRRTVSGECLYMTKCEIQDSCVRFTACERFNFGGVCLSEQISITCYASLRH